MPVPDPPIDPSKLAEPEAEPSRFRAAFGAQPQLGRSLYRLMLVAVVVAGALLVHGFYEPPLSEAAWAWLGRVVQWTPWAAGGAGQLYVGCIHLLQVVVLGIYWVNIVATRRNGDNDIAGPRMSWPDYLLMALAGGGVFMHLTDFPQLGWAMVELTATCLTAIELWRLNTTLAQSLRHPGLLLPLSFATLIAVGTPLLMLPVAVPLGQHVTWLDALFTMTSAVCVTGLTVRDTATGFTPLGQTIIAVFIQLGGLGIIIFGSMFAMLLGKSLSLRENLSLSQMLQDQPLQRMRSLVRLIVIGSLLIELIGAILLYAQWQPAPGESWDVQRRMGLSMFHAVSAFCNAGFDLLGNSFVGYRYATGIHAVILPLIVIGGLGFPVLLNLYSMAAHRLGRLFSDGPKRISINIAQIASPRLSLHTKLVLGTTASVYLLGVIAIVAGQLMPYVYESLDQGVTAHVQRPEQLDLPAAGAILADASFMSLSARTAGFYSMPMDQIEPAGRFTLMTLMCIGGSPGSTAGGIKTTVIALLVLSVVATIRKRREAEAFGRAITDALVRKAATLGICYFGLIALATWLLRLSEPYPLEHLLFEVISAATTTGLTLGITDGLTGFGKAIIMATMFLGRVGPLALLGALMFSSRPQRPYGYAHEDVVLG